MRCGSFLVLSGALLVCGCSGGGEAGAGTQPEAGACFDASKTGSSNCIPVLSSCWNPTWKPPKAAAAACTEGQVADEKSKCWGADVDPSCAAFDRDPANATCLQCLFSSSDEKTYGALILQPNGGALSNVPGCLVLVDGDASATGCGARYQAFEECLDAACMQNCSTFDDYTSCTKIAASNICYPLRLDAACHLKPEYAICTKYTTFDEYFFAIARVFCIAGIDDGGGNDGGTPSDEGGEARAPEPEASIEAGDSGDR